MFEEEDHVFTLSSGKLIALIIVMLCLMLITFVSGLMIGKKEAVPDSIVTSSKSKTGESQGEAGMPEGIKKIMESEQASEKLEDKEPQKIEPSEPDQKEAAKTKEAAAETAESEPAPPPVPHRHGLGGDELSGGPRHHRLRRQRRDHDHHRL